MKNSLKESFKAACEDYHLNFTKGKLMNLAYGKNYSGIDFAIPQAWVNENPHENLFYFVTDCTTGFFEVKNLLDIIPDNLAEKVIRLHELYSVIIDEMDLYKENYVKSPEFYESYYLNSELCHLMN